VDTIELNGTLRRRLHTEYSWVKWIEGIGSIRGLLFHSGPIPTNGVFNTLICFKHQGVQEYQSPYFSECFPEDLDAGKGALTNPGRVSVYPNPAGSSPVHFQGVEDYTRLEVYDIYGRLVVTQIIKNQSVLSLTTENFKPGIYFYRLSGKPGYTQTGKLVVN
jgi:hypothetical protein